MEQTPTDVFETTKINERIAMKEEYLPTRGSVVQRACGPHGRRNRPVITTASVPDGPNGPLMPEIQEAAPHAVYVPRKGEVNAWDNALFVKTVRETGRKTLVMAGVWTNVCVMFPALDAKAEGFKVYAVMDASGDPSEFASRTTLARFTQAGVIPTSANAVICEVHRTWNRPDAAELAQLYTMVSPNYRAVMESYDKAQAVARAKADSAPAAPRRQTAPVGR